MFRLLDWFLFKRSGFKELVRDTKEQDGYITLWDNIKRVRPNDIIRRDMGRILVKTSANHGK